MITYRKFDGKRRFGVELEVGNSVKKPKIRALIQENTDRLVKNSRYSLSTSNSYWHVKDDSTCGPMGNNGPKGIEIASFIARGLDDLKEIADMADLLAKSKVTVNNYCGLHIHADASDINANSAGIIIANWLKIERFLSLALPSRRFSIYCELLLTTLGKQYDIFFENKDLKSVDFYKHFMPNNLSYYGNIDRRVNLNFVNYYRSVLTGSDVRKTIELRWPEGTLNSKDITNWVKLYLNFIDNAKNLNVPKKWEITLDDFLDILGLGKNNILDENLIETKIWLLERIINNKNFEINKYICEIYDSDRKIGCPFVEKEEILNHLNYISKL